MKAAHPVLAYTGQIVPGKVREHSNGRGLPFFILEKGHGSRTVYNRSGQVLCKLVQYTERRILTHSGETSALQNTVKL